MGLKPQTTALKPTNILTYFKTYKGKEEKE
jgi:hypothetical protein